MVVLRLILSAVVCLLFFHEMLRPYKSRISADYINYYLQLEKLFLPLFKIAHKVSKPLPFLVNQQLSSAPLVILIVLLLFMFFL